MKNGKKEDKRVVYTKIFLREALLELLKEKPIDKISITELCRKAEINRNTFYTHYYSPEDVLKETEDEISDRILSLLSESIGGEGNSLLLEICRLIYEKRDLCRILLSENGNPVFLERVIETCRDKVFSEWKNLGIRVKPEVTDLAFRYIVDGSVSIIRSWITSDLDIPHEEIAELIDTVSAGGITALAEK